MTKCFRLIGFVLLFLLLLLIILGINSSSEVQISQTHHLQVPLSLIWQYITDAEKIPAWINQMPVNYCESDTFGLITCFENNSNEKNVFTISKIEEKKSLNLILNKNRNNPYIKNYVMEINLKLLRDGTTEINCELRYSLNNYFSKIINKLYFEGYQISLLNKNMESLHTYFEKV